MKFCPKRTSWWWPFHSRRSIMYYPPEVGDGAGGCWAGHLIKECTECGLKTSAGIWAAEETFDGKAWYWMRAATAEELAHHGV